VRWTSAAAALLVVLAACSQRAASEPPRGEAPTAPPPSTAGGWTTYDRDAARSGADPSEPPLGALRRAWTAKVDGAVYAQPLVSGGRVFIATENDSVYALDAASGRVVWRTHVATPVAGSDLPCGDVDPSGITGTPVVGDGAVFAVAFVASSRHHELYALDVSTGRVRWHRPVDAAGANPTVEQQRAALVVDGGRVYVAYGGLFGDCGAYHGWVVGVNEDGAGALSSYRVPSTREAGIWAPPGPSLLPSGDLLVATGNSAGSTTFDYGNAVLRLSPALRQVDYFADAAWAALNASDTDLGSMTPLPLSGGLVFQIGKAGVGYLLRADHLGGTGGQTFESPVCTGGAYGGNAYRAPMVFVPCRDALTAIRVGGNAFTIAWRSSVSNPGPPIVAGGAVWTIALDSGVLTALDPSTGKVLASAAVGSVEHFTSPSTAGGRIYVPAGASVVAFAGV
jgi:outer membrane protein assembly factor BamB